MKFKYLNEGYFKNPEEVKKSRERNSALDDASRVSKLAAHVIIANLEQYLNKLLTRGLIENINLDPYIKYEKFFSSVLASNRSGNLLNDVFKNEKFIHSKVKIDLSKKHIVADIVYETIPEIENAISIKLYPNGTNAFQANYQGQVFNYYNYLNTRLKKYYKDIIDTYEYENQSITDEEKSYLDILKTLEIDLGKIKLFENSKADVYVNLNIYAVPGRSTAEEYLKDFKNISKDLIDAFTSIFELSNYGNNTFTIDFPFSCGFSVEELEKNINAEISPMLKYLYFTTYTEMKNINFENNLLKLCNEPNMEYRWTTSTTDSNVLPSLNSVIKKIVGDFNNIVENNKEPDLKYVYILGEINHSYEQSDSGEWEETDSFYCELISYKFYKEEGDRNIPVYIYAPDSQYMIPACEIKCIPAFVSCDKSLIDAISDLRFNFKQLFNGVSYKVYKMNEGDRLIDETGPKLYNMCEAITTKVKNYLKKIYSAI